jgi:hypothetical protein
MGKSCLASDKVRWRTDEKLGGVENDARAPFPMLLAIQFLMMYLVAFLSALLVDTIPVFAPPAWTILTFLIIKFSLNPWAVLLLGAVGSTIGRWILTLYIPKLAKNVLSCQEIDNMRFIGNKIGGRFWPSFTFVLIYSLTPLSTTALFTAAALVAIRSLYILPAFFLGKLGSDAVMIFTGTSAVDASRTFLDGTINWQSAVGASLSLALVLGIMFVDWMELLQNKKLRLHFRILA